MSAPNGNDAGFASVPEPEQRQTKRRRTIYVCDLCREKKNRCDGERPACGACQKRGTPCLYSHHQKPPISGTQGDIDTLKSRIHILEQQLAAQSGNGQSFVSSPYVEGRGVSSPSASLISDAGPGIRSSISTQPSSMHGFQQLATPAHSIFSLANSLDYQPQRRLPSIIPSAERRSVEKPLTGSRRVVDNESGRPRNPEDIGHQTPAADPVEQSSAYFGESSTFDFMTKVCSPGEDTSRGHGAVANHQSPASASTSLAISSPSAPIFEGYVLGLGSDDQFSLPNRFVADRLVDAYFKFTHPLNTYLHENSFRQRYACLWLSKDLGGETVSENNLAWFGLVNLIFAFGSNHAQVVGRISVDRTRFFKRAKTLVFSSIFQAGSIELVQALLLMGQYLHSSLELDNSWTVVGLAIHKAQGLGLHLDVINFTTNVIDQEIRKRVWWGCFVLDRILSMKVGRPPTIHDGPGITVGLPLAIDDEYLTNSGDGLPVQPPGIPSKLDFLTYVIPQCRLLERICMTLYSGGQVDISKQGLTDIPKLLAFSIQLDGDLVAWQQKLPPHLRFDSQVQGWHFERQRNTLLMRFLNFRLLLHRQILLIYLTRQCPDSFQRQIIYACVQRCVMAAYDTICQVQLLSQRRLLHSWWHNSHNIFAALCVMLAFKTLGPPKIEDIGLLETIDVDHVISQGKDLLQEIGRQCHPLASRYLQSFQKLEARLPTLSFGRARNPEPNLPPVETPSLDKQRRTEDSHYSFLTDTNDAFGLPPRPLDERLVDDPLAVYDEDLSQIENMFFSTSWANLVED